MVDVIILQKIVECFGNKLITIIQPKCLDFVFQLRLDEYLEHLKTLPFGFQRIHSHIP